jgi:DNA-binding response OmpR family regulator
VHSNSRLYSEIEKTHPDVVVMDLDLYAKIHGVETSKKIRTPSEIDIVKVIVLRSLWQQNLKLRFNKTG